MISFFLQIIRFSDQDGRILSHEQDFKIVEVLFDGVWASPKLTRRTPEVHSYQVSCEDVNVV